MSWAELKVGDRLYAARSYGRGLICCKVRKITGTGRVVLDSYTLNPDLTVRGAKGYGSPYRFVRETPELATEFEHATLAARICAKATRENLADMSVERLRAIDAVLCGKEE